MEVEGEAELDTANSQVSRGPRGEKKWDWYAGKDMGDAQVGGLYFTEARREVSADRAGCRISFLGKSNNGRGGQGGSK